MPPHRKLRAEGVSMVEALRVDRGLTIDQVAEATGLAPRTIRRYELATTRPVGDGLERLARFYNVRASELLSDIRARYTDPKANAVAA